MVGYCFVVIFACHSVVIPTVMRLFTPTLGAGTWVIDGQPEFSEYPIKEVPDL